MTAPASTQKLMYMFALIEDDKLVKDPDHSGIYYGGLSNNLETFLAPMLDKDPDFVRDRVFLVPENLIPYAPSRDLWDRVATDSVEYFTGKWINWEDGPFPASLPPEGSRHISVFIAPLSQYEQLNEERDKLTELRMENLSKHPEKAPSTGAKTSTFIKDNKSAPIAIGRPKEKYSYPVPISILQPEFAQFRKDIVSGPLSPELAPLARKWRDELSEYFATETEREAKFHELLSELLDGLKVSKKKFSGYETDGGVDLMDVIELLVVPLLVEVKTEFNQSNCDGFFELVLYYLEGTRKILRDDIFKGDWRKTRIPSLLLIHNGPYVQAIGAVDIGETYVEPISSSIPLYFNEFDTASLENLLRFMTALRHLFRSLYAVYQKPNDHAVDADQVRFPHVRSYQSSSGVTIPFTYMERVSRIRLVFTACTEDCRKIIVKFGYGQYGVDAHKAAAQAGLAPDLLNYTKLPGGWWMVVMDRLEDGFLPCDEIGNIERPCREVINSALSKFHGLGFVHGDMRDTNVFVRFYEGRWQCQIIDYDWAGREGEVVYPIGVYSSTDVWRPGRYMDGQLITSEHDRRTVEEFLYRRTIVNRFE
ncbi:hypothetical protein BT96DRAFT_1025391, partial [Gymnopus androsaceus JB14]